MARPLSQDYNEAIQDAQSCFTDPELRAGEATCNAMGMPMPRSGNFADVYEFNTPATNGKWAIKCFTRHVPGLRERYTEISSGLLGAKLPFAVDFQYLVQGIRVRGDWFPILKMRWVEGQLLNELVRDNLDKPALLGQLGLIWGRMAKRLREAGIAHADLQHGNVILVPGSKSGSVAVKLIDYDGMFVPALASKKSGEVGHPNYQHPQRLREGIYNAEVDRFPLLVVATALRALSIGGRELWERYDNSDNLLFRESDLQAPGKSALFKELHNLADPQTRMLAEELHKAAERDFTEVPLIEDLLPDTKTTKTVSALAPGKPPALKAGNEAPAEEQKAAEETAPPDADAVARTEPKRKSVEKSGGMPKWVWIAGGGAVAVGFIAVIGIAFATMAFMGGDGKKGKNLVQGNDNLPKIIPPIEIKKKIPGGDPVVLAPAKRFPATVAADSPAKWRVAGNELVQSAVVPDVSIYFGDPNWTDYDFSVDAKLTQNEHGFGLWFRRVDEQNASIFAVGPFGNTRHVLHSLNGGKWSEQATRGINNEPLKNEQWYSAKLSIRGENGSCFLDGVKQFDFKIDRRNGSIGLRTWNAACHFKNIKVTAPDGTVLLEGLPEVAPVPVVAEGFVPLFNGTDLTGWKKHANYQGEWRVENGVLIGEGPNFAVLHTTRDDFRDFHLRAELRITTDDNVDASGLTFRSAPGLQGYEVLMIGGKVIGNINVRTNNKTTRMSAVQNPANVQSGEWFTLDIITEGNVLKIKVNGVSTVNFKDIKAEFTSGQIALRRAPKALFECRKIEIKELNAGPGPDLVAGEVHFMNRHSGKLISVNNGESRDGAVIHQWEYFPKPEMFNQKSNQMWRRVASDQDWFYLVNRNSGTYLSVDNDSRDEGARLVLWRKKEGELSQQWKFVPAYPLNFQNDIGWFKIINRASGKAIAVLEGSKLDRAPLVMSDPVGGASMAWKLDNWIDTGKVPPADPLVVSAEGFTQLFNGKDLTGWRLSPSGFKGDWRVEDGVLIGSGPETGYLFTTRGDYKDFQLRVEGRFSGTDGNGIGQVLPRHSINWRGYEAQIRRGPGTIGHLQVSNFANLSKHGVGKGVKILSGEWFVMDIFADGNRMKVHVNGKLASEFVDAQDEFSAFMSGHVGLRHDGNYKLEVRKIEIKELNTGASPPVVANQTTIINRNSGKAIGIFANLKADGSALAQWQFTKDAANQQWVFVPADKGWSYIMSVHSGTYLSVANDANNDGTQLVIWQKKNGQEAQQWKPVPVDGEWVRIINRASGKAIDVQAAGKANGVPVVLNETNDSASQAWKIDNGIVVAKEPPPKTKIDPPVKTVRVAVPDPDKVMQSEKEIREQFKKEYAKKTNAELIALADKLLQLSKETNDSPTDCYALLRESRSLATKAGAVELAMKAAVEMIGKYEIDESATKVDTLVGLSKAALNAESTKQLVEAVLSHSAAALADDHFDSASKMVAAAEAALTRNKNGVLLAQVQKQDKQIKDITKEHADMKKAQEKLMEDAKDPGANLTAGVYLAFRKGDWEKGLPLLALCGQADLQELAKKDLAAGEDDKTRVEVGDAWWNGADKKPALQKSAMQWRAAYWYRQALPTLTGLTQTKIADRVKQIDAQPAPFRIAGAVAEVDRYKGHAGTVSSLQLSSDGKRVFSCGADGTMREWNFTTGKSRVLLGPQLTKGPLTGLAVTADEHHVALQGAGGKFFVLDLVTKSAPKFGKGDRDTAPGLYWLSNTMVAHAYKKDWHTWEPVRGSGSSGPLIIGPASDLRGNARALVIAPELDFGAAFFEGGICTFKMSGNGGRSPHGVVPVEATTAAFSKDTRFIVAGGADGNLQVFSTRSGGTLTKELAPWKGHTGIVRCAAYTPDGQKILTGGDDKTLRVWDAATGKALHRFPHQGAVTAVLVTPDNRYAITASADSIIRMWSLTKGSQPVATGVIP